MSLPIGMRLGAYEVLGSLGAGGQPSLAFGELRRDRRRKPGGRM